MEGDTRYFYDGLNQLTKIEYPTLTEELFYDKAGNRTRRVAHGVEEQYAYDPRNRLVSHSKDGIITPYRYDHAGNLLADDKALYSYDAFNRAERVETFDGNIQINRYDAEGLRYEMEENGNLVRFIFNQNRETVSEEDSSGLNRLIRGTELIASHSSADSARTYYHYASDEMGSTTHITDEDGKVLNRYAYDAFGNLTEQVETVPNRFKYNGQQLDPITQQYYLRARFYNPVVARFTQEDVYRGDGLNLYVYSQNNPIIYNDPSGYSCQSTSDIIAGQKDGGLPALPAPQPLLALPAPAPVLALPPADGLVINGHYIPQPDNPNLRVGIYGSFKNDHSIPGQTHHPNQDAAFKGVIPTHDAVSVKMEGNTRTDAGMPHTVFHGELQSFWKPYQDAGTKPTVHQYNIAVFNAFKKAGLTSTEALQVMRFSIAQQAEYNLIGGEVPNVPGRMYVSGY